MRRALSSCSLTPSSLSLAAALSFISTFIIITSIYIPKVHKIYLYFHRHYYKYVNSPATIISFIYIFTAKIINKSIPLCHQYKFYLYLLYHNYKFINITFAITIIFIYTFTAIIINLSIAAHKKSAHVNGQIL